jgi:hypothetical protein
MNHNQAGTMARNNPDELMAENFQKTMTLSSATTKRRRALAEPNPRVIF